MPGKNISAETGCFNADGCFPANWELKANTSNGGTSKVRNAKLLRVR